MNASAMNSQSQKFCSFCKKPRDAVAFIIEKPGIVICSECVSRFGELLKDPNYGEKTTLYQDCSRTFHIRHPCDRTRDGGAHAEEKNIHAKESRNYSPGV